MDAELERFRLDWRREVHNQQGRRADQRAPGSTEQHDAVRIQDQQLPGDTDTLARNHLERLQEPADTTADARRRRSRSRTTSPVSTRNVALQTTQVPIATATPLPERISSSRASIASSEAEDEPDAQASQLTNDPKDDATDEPRQMTALELYEQGVLRERQGALSDALVHYRMAFKKDPNVDRLFREAFRAGTTAEAHFDRPHGGNSALEDTGYAKFVQTTPDYDSKKGHKMSEEMATMMKMMSSLRMPIEADDEVKEKTTVADLPEEVLNQIVHHTIVSSAGSAYTALSLTCQKLFLMTLDRAIWRDLCLRTYWPQVYLNAGAAVKSDSEYDDYRIRLEEEARAHYKDDWQRMFIEKPRIRYDGIYIATCDYTRPGEREGSLQWTNPVHLVTYFRYARFYSDGRCLTLLTSSEPKDVVHQVRLDSKLKGLQPGTWAMDPTDGTVCIDTRGPADYLFFITLQCKSSSRGRQNKLAWKRFYGVHPVSGAETHFNLRHDRSYYFSKVKSYGLADSKPTSANDGGKTKK